MRTPVQNISRLIRTGRIKEMACMFHIRPVQPRYLHHDETFRIWNGGTF